MTITSADKQIIQQMPKAELHVHFVGAARWQTIRELNPQAALLPATPPWYSLPGPTASDDDESPFRPLPAPGLSSLRLPRRNPDGERWFAKPPFVVPE